MPDDIRARLASLLAQVQELEDFLRTQRAALEAARLELAESLNDLPELPRQKDDLC